MAENTQLPYMVNNQTVVSAGGLDIKVVGNTITFTIPPSNWEMTVAELESMLESHQLFKDACKQMLSCVFVPISSEKPIYIIDNEEFINGVNSADQALRRAD